MLISEFDLCKREWLSLVFKDRNQQYGAYELRNHYSDIMVKAMAATFLLVGLAAGAVTIISHHRPVIHEADAPPIVIPVTLNPDKVYEAPKPKELQKPKQAQEHQAPAKATPVSMQNLNYKVTPNEQVLEDPKPIDPNIASGPVDIHIDGAPTIQNPGMGTENGTGKTDAAPAAVNNEPFAIAEVMPEPAGGEKAWIKFLQKNLHFPVIAQENGASGKVYISFIVEKDGHLSDITLLRKAGFGFDEEALRVMKIAPAWKPGMQNGQNVRVRFTIPINFQLSEN